MYKKIKLTQGQHTIIDADDFDRVNRHKWQAKLIRGKKNHYRAQGLVNGKIVPLSRFIMDKELSHGLVVDHINHDCLDNRKANLRVCTRSQNQWNKSPNYGRDCKGVFYLKNNSKKRWMAKIQFGKPSKTIWNKMFMTKQEAMAAYDKKATEMFGEFALTNKAILKKEEENGLH